MDFDQGQFNFDAGGPEDGYRKWRQELDAKKQAFESRWGVILGRTVRVSLRNHAKDLTGRLEWEADAGQPQSKSPVFKLRGVHFTAQDIESIVQVEGES